MQDFTTVDQLQNATVYGTDGDKIGSVGQVYLDDQTNQPTFVTVRTGLFGMKETFIPVSKATQAEDGLQVPFEKAFVKDAPNIDADGDLTPDEERRIYEYYSMEYQPGRQAADRTDRGEQGDAVDPARDAGTGTRPGADVDAARAAASGTAASGVSALGVQRGESDDTAADLDRDVNTPGRGPGTGQDTESVVARNEHLDVGTEVHETGRVRLRKHAYTDTETVEVPVSREEVVVEREPVDPDSPEARRDTGDQEVEVTTREEVPVVDKTATAEKVSADKTRVEDTEKVAGTVQREDIDVDGDGGTAGRR